MFKNLLSRLSRSKGPTPPLATPDVLTCPTCAYAGRKPAKSEGRVLKCPRCKEPIRVPTTMEFLTDDGTLPAPSVQPRRTFIQRTVIDPVKRIVLTIACVLGALLTLGLGLQFADGCVVLQHVGAI